MRSFSSVARSFVMFGLGLCACAITLLSIPTSALADSVEIRLDGYPIRLYENRTKTTGQLSQLNDSGTVNKLMRKFIYDDDSMTGLVDPNYSYTNPEIDRVYDYSVDLHDQNAYGYELLKSETFPATSGAVDNSFLGVYIHMGTTLLAPGQKFRVIMPMGGLYMECYPDSTTTNSYYISMGVDSVWTGTNANELQKCTMSQGAYVVGQNTSIILVRLNTNGRSAARVNGAHSYILYGYPRIIFDLPSVDAQVINEQSVSNTTNINNQSVTNTNAINNKIQTETNKQTNALKDTTGSGTIASGAVNQYKGTFENNGVVSKIGPIQNALKDAVFANDVQSVVPFPGMSIMGFEIQQQEVTIPENVLGLLSTIRFMTTLAFVGYFCRYLYGWVNAIWGLSDVERQVELEWIVEEEDLSSGVKRRL